MSSGAAASPVIDDGDISPARKAMGDAFFPSSSRALKAADAAIADSGLTDFDAIIKVLVVGNGGVGKSSMTARYAKGVFTSSYKKTIGVDYLEKDVALASGENAKLMLWDTAGQDEFAALTSTYYRGAGACALVFSTVDRASFDALDGWRSRVAAAAPADCALALVQNKVDLAQDALMTDAEVAALAARWAVPLFKTCVKDNVGVDELFSWLAAAHLTNLTRT